VTTYSAQGSTVDRAFVAADPPMDKQEMYVAMSRSRGETRLYATPEIQVHREEIAPASVYLREGIPHIAEASERDRAQLAAQEVALRSRFSGLPTEELVSRHRELDVAAGREATLQERHNDLMNRIERGREAFEGYRSQRDGAEALPRRERAAELGRIGNMESRSRDQIAHLEAELRETPAPGDSARREFAVADRVLAERRQLAITAARISPSPYITKELGERPSDPTKRHAWDRDVSQIETYRQRHGIKDQAKPFGQESKRGAERARRQQALRRLQQVQKALGLGQHAARARALGRGMGIGR
jgi:hypothetical protein